MPSARDIKGPVFKNSSAILVARVIGVNGTAITKATISAAKYTIYQLDDDWPDNWEVVSGHQDVALVVANVIYDTLQKDELWKNDAGQYIDDLGYNFKHEIVTSSNEAFPIAGVEYLIDVELTPSSGQEIHVRFRGECI